MEKNIKIFYHAYLINDYKELVIEQLTNVFYSGLYKKCQHLYIGVVAQEAEKSWIIDITKKYSKIKLHFFDGGDEKQTLNLIRDLIEPEDYILYFHTKGITHKETSQNLWRKLMEYKTINEWRLRIKELDSGYDCVGPLYRENTYLGYHPHFSGGFWWTKYDHILTLQHSYLDKDYIHGRMGAEFWIGSNHNFKKKCVHKLVEGTEPFLQNYTIKDYIHEEDLSHNTPL